MSTEKKLPLYLIVRTDERASCNGTALELSIEVCTIRNGQPYGMTTENRAMDQMALKEVLYSDHPDWRPSAELTTRQLYSPSINDLRGIVKLADSIARKLDKVADAAGPASSFGAQVLRFANAIGAVGMFRKVKDTRNEWDVIDLKHAAYHADHIVEQFRDKHAPQPAEPVTA